VDKYGYFIVPLENAEALLYEPFLIVIQTLCEACILMCFSILVSYQDDLSVMQVQK
jgi:hypothetical protein